MNNEDKAINLDQQLCFEVYQAHKTFNKFYKQALKDWGLTYAQYIVMLALYQYGTQSVKQLGEKVALDSGTLTPLLRRLEKDNWINRQRSLDDERRLEIKPSEYAVSQKDAIFARVSGCLDLLNLSKAQYNKYMNDISLLTLMIEQANSGLKQEQEEF